MIFNRIREFRIIHGLTQTQLAEELEISKNAISDLENGKYSPRLETAIKLSNRLGVNVETLFFVCYDYNLDRENVAREYLDSLQLYEQYEYII